MKEYLDKQEHFGLRKLSVGLTSVLISSSILLGANLTHQVKADTVTDGATTTQQAKSETNSSENKPAEVTKHVNAPASQNTPTNTPANKQAGANASANTSSNAGQASQIDKGQTENKAPETSKVANKTVANPEAVKAAQNGENGAVQGAKQGQNEAGKANQAGQKTQTLDATKKGDTANLRESKAEGTNKDVVTHESYTRHATVNYHYAQDSDASDGNIAKLVNDNHLAVDSGKAGKDYHASKNIDVTVNYDKTLSGTGDSQQSSYSNFTLADPKQADNLALNGNKVTWGNNIFFDGDKDATLNKYVAVIKMTRHSVDPNSPETSTSVQYALDSTLKDFNAEMNLPTTQKGNEKIKGADYTYDVYLYKRPYKVDINYINKDGKQVATKDEGYKYYNDKIDAGLDSDTAYRYVLANDKDASINLAPASDPNANNYTKLFDVPYNSDNKTVDYDPDVLDKDWITPKLGININVNDRTGEFGPDTPEDKIPKDPKQKDDKGNNVPQPTHDTFSQDVTRDFELKSANPNVVKNMTKPAQQKVTVTRTGVYDYATQTWTFKPWTSQTMDAVKAPDAPDGYKVYVENGAQTTVDGKPAAASVSVGGSMQAPIKHQTVIFDYVQNGSVVVHYNYVDQDDNNKLVGTTAVSGVGGTNIHPKDQVVKNVPEHYEIADPDAIADPLKLGDKDQSINVPVKHKIDKINYNDPRADQTKMTRTIEVTNPVIGAKTSTVQTIHYGADGEMDEVTGNVTKTGDWQALDNNGEFGAYTVPEVKNYTPDTADKKTVPSEKPAKVVPNHNETVKVGYTANQSQKDVNYIDPDGKTVGSTKLPGADAGSTIDLTKPENEKTITQNVPKGYKIKGDLPKTTINNDDPLNVNVTPATLQKEVHYVDGDKVVGNTKLPEASDGATIDLTKSENKKAIKNGVPDGYEIKGDLPKSTKNDGTTLNIPVAAKGQEIHYIYQDPKKPNDPPKVISTQNIPGKKGDEVPIYTPDQNKDPENTLHIPDGWRLDPTQKVPDKVKVDPDKPLDIKIIHGFIETDKDHKKGDPVINPKTGKPYTGQNGDPVTYQQDVGKDKDGNSEYDKTMSRVITVTTPDGKVNKITQSATAHSKGVIDTVTGDLLGYTKWTPDTKSFKDAYVGKDGKVHFKEYDAPEIKGYTATPKKADDVAIDFEGQNPAPVNIKYTKNAEKPAAKPDNGGGNTGGGNVTPTPAPTPTPTPDTPAQKPDTKPSVKPDVPKDTPELRDDNNEPDEKTGMTIGYYNDGHKTAHKTAPASRNYAAPVATGHVGQVATAPATVTSAPLSQVASAAHSDNANMLPQTGASDSMAVVALGLAMLTLGSGMMLLKKKED